ncbi:MAG: DUF111 family protein [Sedimentisphaerales bacterium]|nr:DUF111 family protein [Sedimentisphaerales bacterium]
MLLLLNVDDISGEHMPYLIDGLMERGAASVHVVQAITKKGRLEFLFFIDAPREAVNELAGFMASEAGTLGVRAFEPDHIRFEYHLRPVKLTFEPESGIAPATVAVKEVVGKDGQVGSLKAEQEDLRRVVAQIRAAGQETSLPSLKRLVEQAAAGRVPISLGNIHAELEEER